MNFYFYRLQLASGGSGPSPCSVPKICKCEGTLHWVNTATAKPLSTAAICPAKLELLETTR